MSHDPRELFDQGFDAHVAGDLVTAEGLYRRALARHADLFDARHLLGVVCLQTERLDEAVAHLARAVELAPGEADAHYNLGNARRALGAHAAAIEAYERAAALRPDHSDAVCNAGVCHNARADLGRALACFDLAARLAPGDADVHCNRGIVLDRLERFDEAAAAFSEAVRLAPDHVEAWSRLVHTLQVTCAWAELEAPRRRLLAALESGAGITPWLTVMLPVSPAVQLSAANVYVAAHLPAGEPLVSPRAEPHDGPLRVGYLCAAFHEHASSYLTAELFERHDPRRVTTFGYSYGPDDGSPMRRRMQAAFPVFRDLRGLDDPSLAARIVADRLDVLVDMQGHQRDSLPWILARRPAPVLAHFVGTPGTLGRGVVDYLVADPFVVPPASRRHYAEALIVLPDCYQPNGSGRPRAPAHGGRSEHGLPDEGLVLCCFNASYKITPEVFEVWTRLLRRLPDAVLWLYRGGPTAETNLRRAAADRGVDPDRLCFAGHAPLAEHLARYRHADLFLDTTPCGGHTTASDALWAGCPLITWVGETLASRVAGSLLTVLGLPELICRTAEEYEATALEVAEQAEARAALGRRLRAGRDSGPLFDAARYASYLEEAWGHAVGRARAGLPPETFHVGEGET